jgi:transcription antitermination factor NusG
MDEKPQKMLAEECAVAWYVVQVKRYEEHRVIRYLATKPISTFLPLIESSGRRNTRRGFDRLEPLFPGYLFVQMRPLDLLPEHWHILRWTPGVRRILGTDATPVPMPAEAILAIQERMRGVGYVRLGMRFGTGARVRIRSGPLAGLEGIFDRPVSRRGRVLVLLEMLGQMGRTEVDELELESA